MDTGRHIKVLRPCPHLHPDSIRATGLPCLQGSWQGSGKLMAALSGGVRVPVRGTDTDR